MDTLNNRAYVYEFNNLSSQINSVYHSAAQKIGISDCALSIYFMLYSSDIRYTQSDICDKLCLSRQTVNSALQKMRAEGYITLVRAEEKTGKHIVLTDKGSEFIKDNILPLVRIENAVCEKFTDEEKQEFLIKYQRLIQYLKEENEKAGIILKL